MFRKDSGGFDGFSYTSMATPWSRDPAADLSGPLQPRGAPQALRPPWQPEARHLLELGSHTACHFDMVR